METLGPGHIAPDALGLALLQIHLRQLFKGAAGDLRLGVLAPAVEGHLLRRGPGLAHDRRLGLLGGGVCARSVELRQLRGDLGLELLPVGEDVERAVFPGPLHDRVRVTHPVVVRVELLHGQAVLLQQQRSQDDAVGLGPQVFLAPGAVHDDLDRDGRPVPRAAAAVPGVPAHLGVLQVLPRIDVVHIVMDAGVVHVGIGPRRPGVLLSVLLHILQVVGVVDGHARHLAGAPGEPLVRLELLALLIFPGVLGPLGPPGDDLLVDDEAALRPRRVRCQFCHGGFTSYKLVMGRMTSSMSSP